MQTEINMHGYGEINPTCTIPAQVHPNRTRPDAPSRTRPDVFQSKKMLFWKWLFKHFVAESLLQNEPSEMSNSRFWRILLGHFASVSRFDFGGCVSVGQVVSVADSLLRPHPERRSRASRGPQSRITKHRWCSQTTLGTVPLRRQALSIKTHITSPACRTRQKFSLQRRLFNPYRRNAATSTRTVWNINENIRSTDSKILKENKSEIRPYVA